MGKRFDLDAATKLSDSLEKAVQTIANESAIIRHFFAILNDSFSDSGYYDFKTELLEADSTIDSICGDINDLIVSLKDYTFAMGELLARIRAMTRRKTEFAPNSLKVGNVTLDRERFVISTPEGGEQKLGNKEFQVLEMLMLNRNVLISTERLMEKIWGFDAEAEISVVWVYISYIRKKLTAVKADIEIKASRGVGYTLEVRE